MVEESPRGEIGLSLHESHDAYYQVSARVSTKRIRGLFLLRDYEDCARQKGVTSPRGVGTGKGALCRISVCFFSHFAKVDSVIRDPVWGDIHFDDALFALSRSPLSRYSMSEQLGPVSYSIRGLPIRAKLIAWASITCPGSRHVPSRARAIALRYRRRSAFLPRRRASATIWAIILTPIH